jgi:hypothetical protein
MCAYVVRKDYKAYPVVVDKLGAEFDQLDAPVIDESGTHVAFRARGTDKKGNEAQSVLYDGKVVATDEWVGPIALSPADGVPAYWIGRGTVFDTDGIFSDGAGQLVWGKRKTKKWVRCDLAQPPVFSQDGTKLFAISSRDDDWRVVILDAKGKEDRRGDGDIYEVALSSKGEAAWTVCRPDPDAPPSSPRFFFVQRENKQAAEREGEPPSLPQATDSEGGPVFSADGKRLFYKARHLGKFGVGVDGIEKVPCKFDFIEELAPNPRSDEIAFSVCSAGKSTATYGRDVFANAIATGGEWTVVRGTTTSDKYEHVCDLTWSPDGKSLAYAAFFDKGWHVVVGAKASEPCDEIATISWSSDCKSVWYGCRVEKELWWRVLALE